MQNNPQCIGCREYTNAPDGEWHCQKGSCEIHRRLDEVRGVRQKAAELNIRPELVKTDAEIISEIMGIEIGRKFDTGKPRLAETIQDFRIPLTEISKVWAFGADKYEKGNWRYVENGLDRYTNAMLRHLCAEADNFADDESELAHAAHVAWNALARLHFIMEAKKLEENHE